MQTTNEITQFTNIQNKLKFKAWNKINKKIINIKIIDFKNKKYNDTHDLSFENCILLQYTKYNDKNNQEIYEGDIVKGIYPKRNAIIQPLNTPEGSEGFLGLNINPIELPTTYPIKASNLNQCEIIGNIFENPEITQL